MATLKDLERSLRNVDKQVRFAQAQALTKVAREVEQAERRHLEQVFDNPTPFTLKSIKSIGARRDNLQAKVFIQRISKQDQQLLNTWNKAYPVTEWERVRNQRTACIMGWGNDYVAQVDMSLCKQMI